MRVKGGVVTRRRHKRLLKRAEGFRGRRGGCFRLAERAVEKALQYAYRHRRAKKREFRSLWITRINAAARENGLTYGKLILGLRKANMQLDRKVLADMCVTAPQAFAKVVEQAKAAL